MDAPSSSNLDLNIVQQQRLDVINNLRSEGIEPFGHRYDRTHDTETAKAAFDAAEKANGPAEHF
ncbi:MAG TPA: hypothetical protein PLY73_12460, partial [Candidatus Ozemobacteraceae bacterium]|nr:hypothetical protein [Candidatus Ozemobacteraceae bacterium]